MIDVLAEKEAFLAHYGVKGMKWGKRKSTASDPKPKGKYRVHKEAKFIKKGFSLSEAERKASTQIKIEKTLAIAAGVAVASLAAYSVSKAVGKKYVGVSLKEGSKLTYVNALGDKANFDRRLYTSFKKSDTDKYRSTLAKALKRNKEGTVIYETVLTAKEKIKAPSHKQAEKLYKEFTYTLKGYEGQKARLQGYKEFNKNLVFDKEDGKKFMDFVKSKGFNALIDSNDQFISGYNTQKPIILLNASSSAVKTGQKILSDKFIDDTYNKVIVKEGLKAISPAIGIGVGMLTGMGILNKADLVSNKYNTVNEYVIKNPNIKKSYSEIYASLKPNNRGGWVVTE